MEMNERNGRKKTSTEEEYVYVYVYVECIESRIDNCVWIEGRDTQRSKWHPKQAESEKPENEKMNGIKMECFWFVVSAILLYNKIHKH